MNASIQTTAAFLAIGALAGAARAQLSVPEFSSTSTGGETLGLYFQAPVDFVINGVQVPDESHRGTQTVAIYDLASAPASLPATTTATPSFFKAGITSRGRIDVNPPLAIAKGRWLCILGACGATSGLPASSIGASPHTSWVLRNDFTMRRLVMAANIASNSGVGDLAADPSTRVGLGRVLISVVGGGEAETYGDSGPTKSFTGPDTRRPPDLCREGGFFVGAGSGANNGGLVAIGITRVQWAIPGLGTLYVLPLVTLPIAGPITSPHLVKIQIPDDPTLVGQRLYFQSVINKVSSFELTNGLQWTFGR